MKIKYSEGFWTILSGLRFWLASVVFVFHLLWFAKLSGPSRAFIAFGGKAAVIGFLLISGISIGYSYRQKSNGFYMRRFLRIYPLYFFAVLLSLLLVCLLGAPYHLPYTDLSQGKWEINFAPFLFLQEFLFRTTFFNGPLWSLSIEVFLYILTPFLAKVRSPWLYVGIILSMIAFCFSPAYTRDWIFGYPALRYAWPWLIGFLISAKGELKQALFFMALGTIAIWMNKFDTHELLSPLTFLIVCTFIVVCGSVSDLTIPRRLGTAINFLGDLSYPLYLFHVPLAIILFQVFRIENVWLYISMVLVLIVPINYIFDIWLKRIFWKPFALWVVDWFTKYRKAFQPV